MFYLVDKTEDLSLEDSLSDGSGDCSEEVRGQPAYLGVLQQ